MIKDDIETYCTKLDVKFARNNNIKMLNTLKRVRKFIQEELEGNTNVQFTSQLLRVWTMKIEKVLKALNKSISFTEFRKRFEKYDNVTRKELFYEIHGTREKIQLAQDLEFMYANLCNLATLLLIIEKDKEQYKEKCDKEFQKAIQEALDEVMV